MTQIFAASTLFGAMTLAAAIDAGRFGPPGPRRILLISNNAAIPELATPADRAPGFDAVAGRFDEVRSWNEVIAPLHPADWQPPSDMLPMLGRMLRELWGLGSGPVELAVESVSFSYARALSAIFYDAPITVYSDGLMSYGPTRMSPAPGVGTRITRQLHLDLVPGLEPRLLSEYGVPIETVPDEPFVKVLQEVGAAVAPLLARYGSLGENAALIVGQYLAELEILTEAEEEEVHLDILRGLAARGHDPIVFKPHPRSAARVRDQMAAEAGQLGVRLVIGDDPVPAETWCTLLRPAVIAGIFSTALVTANRFFGVPAVTMGTIRLFRRLEPYPNSNRIPATIVDATLPRLTVEGELIPPMVGPAEIETKLVPLMNAVAYCMQPGRYPELRAGTIAYLESFDPDQIPRRYFRPRLFVLDLPGAKTQEADTGRSERRLERLRKGWRR